MSYLCACCGEVHDGLPDIGFDRPIYAHDIPEGERAGRVRLTGDTCVIDGEDYFIRGVLDLPVHGEPEPLGLGVWVSQKRENFEAYLADSDSAAVGPFFGWLSNEVPPFPSTLNLKTTAHFLGGGLRPSIVLEPTEHSLAVAQHEGLSQDEAWALVHEYLDPPAR